MPLEEFDKITPRDMLNNYHCFDDVGKYELGQNDRRAGLERNQNQGLHHGDSQKVSFHDHDHISRQFKIDLKAFNNGDYSREDLNLRGLICDKNTTPVKEQIQRVPQTQYEVDTIPIKVRRS